MNWEEVFNALVDIGYTENEARYLIREKSFDNKERKARGIQEALEYEEYWGKEI